MGNRVISNRLLLLFGKYKSIIKKFEEGKLNKANEKIIEIVAKAYLKEGINKNIDEYIFEARTIIGDFFSNYKKNSRKLFNLYEEADYLFENMVSPQKQLELKAELLTKRDVRSSKAWIILSNKYDVSENPNLAIHFLKNAVICNSDCIVAYYKLGYIYENNIKKIDAAIYYYKKAVLSDPEKDKYEGLQVNARYIQMSCKQLANIMYKKGNYKATMLLLEKAIPLSEKAGYNSHELIRDLMQLAVKSAEKMGIKGKFLNKLYNKYKIEAGVLGNITFV